MKWKLYKFGGCVRDIYLERQSKDTDFVVEAPSFEDLRDYLLNLGYKIYKEKPEFLTIRAKTPEGAADFVVSNVLGKPTGILDFLSHRDLTMNSLALNLETSELLDPFNGLQDIEERVIKCVGDPNERFREDPLRILRAIRFAVTLKSNSIDPTTWEGMFNNRLLLKNVEGNRVREELNKAFKANTFHTLMLIEPLLISGLIFNENTRLWLKVTNEQ